MVLAGGDHVAIGTLIFGSLGACGVPSMMVTVAINAVVPDCFTILKSFQADARPVGISTVAAARMRPARSGSVGPSTTLTAQGRFLLIFLNMEYKTQGLTQYSVGKWTFPIAHNLLATPAHFIPCGTSELWEFGGNYT